MNSGIIFLNLFFSLKVWEQEMFIPVSSYETAHTKKITSIDVMPNVQSVFLSTSMDCKSTIWDTKKSTPAQGNIYIFESLF